MDFKFDSVEKVLAFVLLDKKDRTFVKAPFSFFLQSFLSFLLNLEHKIDLAISSTKSSESKKRKLNLT